MEKNWLKRYDPGVPRTINPDQYSSLVELIDDNCKIFAKEIAYINYGETLTYRQLDHYSLAFAGFLKYKCELLKGDRVAIMMPNLLQYPVAMFGILRAGLVVVNINVLHTSDEIKFILQNSGAKSIIIVSNMADTIESILAETDIKSIIVTELGDLFGGIKGKTTNFFLKRIKKTIPTIKLSKQYSFLKAISFWYRFRFHKIPIDSNDLAVVQYKGDKINTLKGVMLTHRNIVANSQQILTWTDSFFKRKIGPVVIVVPFTHILSFLTGCFLFLRFGITHVIITDPQNMKEVSTELNRQSFSTMIGYNLFFKKVIESEFFKEVDFSKVKFIFSGGGVVQKSVAEKWKEKKIILLTSYGLTEASPIVSLEPLSKRQFEGTVGLPVPSTDVKICDLMGKEIAVGNRGELWIHGPQVMKGYWNDPEGTQKVLMKNGWLKTGDMASIDENGFIRIFDRIEDLIKIGTDEIYPSEVESIINEMQEVKEVAIVQAEASNHEAFIKAFVVKKEDSITAEKIINYCKEHLAVYQVPKEVIFCSRLPKSYTGRLLRDKLR